MITVYLDHNIIDGFDRGETAYLDPLLADTGVRPIISIASVDEIFRGGDKTRSRRNIESLKKLGVWYIAPGPDESHMTISELDYQSIYEKWHETWLRMQSDIGHLNDSHFLFISTLFRGNTQETIRDINQSVEGQVAWIKNNYDKFPSVQTQMDKVLSDPQEYKELSRQLLHLKALLPFTPKEINNIPEKSVFWTCVGKLKSTSNSNLRPIGEFIENEIKSAKGIDDQFEIVFLWLNLFGYCPDDLTHKNRVRSNFSDKNHATNAIACDGMLTLDKKFAKRAAAAMGALKIKTEVGSDVNELLHRIVALSGHSR
jgi:hypothetical protein